MKNNRHINKTLRNALDLPLQDSTELIGMLLLRHAYEKSFVDEKFQEEEKTIYLDNGISIDLKFKVNGV